MTKPKSTGTVFHVGSGDARQTLAGFLRAKLDGCLYGFGLAKDRAANALTSVMIPEALDYPQ